MKLVAKVQRVLRPGIHGIGTIEDGKVVRKEDFPNPDRVVIEVDGSGTACMMYRYTRTGDLCGDTWHEDLESAYGQAEYEYGLRGEDFVEVIEGSVDR